jgi:LCP family protein required for cell wall assembly
VSDPRSSLAAFLSFLVPGLGQAYNGQTALAWLLAAPVLLLALGLGAIAALWGSELLSSLLDVEFLIGLIVLDLTLLGWRLVAILQAHLRREQLAWRWPTFVSGLLVLATLGMHVVPAFYAVKAIDTLHAVAADTDGPRSADDPDRGGLPGFDLRPPSDRPEEGDRVNILLVGVDWLPHRGTQLTDTMLVVSLDPDGGRPVMISIPRDLYGAPLPDGRPWDNKLNALMALANAKPAEFPLGGVGTLKATIANLLGVEIHYFAAMNLIGFAQAIDSIGGVDVMVERAINDPTYADPYTDQVIGFRLTAGLHHMDGELALAYVRSRKGIGDDDFTRAARQQQLLAAVREKLTAGNLLVALPGLLDSVKNLLSTDVPQDQFSELAQIVQEADTADVERVVIAPPLVTPLINHPVHGYVLTFDPEELRALGQRYLAD